VGRAARNQTARNGFPLTARTQVVKDAIHGLTRVYPGSSPFRFGWLWRQQRNDQSPQGVGDTPLGVYFFFNVHSILSPVSLILRNRRLYLTKRFSDRHLGIHIDKKLSID
jgi:hypothetical protein